MRYSIHQVNATTWELRAADGTVVGSFSDALGRTGYDLALSALGGIISEQLATGPSLGGDGLLPEAWASDQGLAFSVALPGGRDFSNCAWSWRDPAACLVPLMFQTETEFGHMGAELAGFVAEFHMSGAGTPAGSGRFYDNDAGRAFRDLLLDGRRFGVSVDPSEAVDVEETFTCTEFLDGECIDGEWSLVFNAYEIAGVTGTPFPGFENAAIMLSDGSASVAPVRAALSIPTAPPHEWLTLAEPRPGVPFLDGMGDDVLVEQLSNAGEVAGVACPLTIRDDGLVYGHLTWWGQCHIADPWGPGVCASANVSANGYADFHTGTVRCADGTDIPTGVLTVGCEHSSAFDAPGVRDHLAHAGMSWANVHIVDGEYGPWLCGVLRADLTDAQVRLLRGLSLSGEWVGELAGILAVNAPGLPVQRALAASAFPEQYAIHRDWAIAPPVLRSSAKNGVLTKLVGGNLVRRCPECEKRARLVGEPFGRYDDLLAEMRATRQLVRKIEMRTRHQIPAEAEALRASFTPDA